MKEYTMIRHQRSVIAVLLLAACAIVLTGCEMEWVKDVARENLASFVTDLVSTAVDGTIAP